MGALFTNMKQNLSGFFLVSVIILAAGFAHQEVKLSRTRDDWRMEDNKEERRKEVKVESLAVNDQNGQDSAWRKVALREGIFKTPKVDSESKEAVSYRREEGEATRRVDSRRREAVSSRREKDDATRRVDSRRREAVSPRREEDEATRRIDSSRREAVSSRREEDQATRRVDSRRREASSRTRSGEDEATITIDTRRGVVESELDTWTMRGAIQNKKQQPETNFVNEEETDGAVKERSKLVLKFNEMTEEDLSCWNMLEIKSLNKIIPRSIQELLIEQAMPMVITLGLIRGSQRKAVY